MTDTTGKDPSLDAPLTPESVADALGHAQAGGECEDMVPAAQVKAALDAAADFKDKLLRTLADMENLRKRTEREVSDARQYGVAGFARDVLQVADNMHRALDHIGDELRDSADPKVKSLVEGLDLTERELVKVLEKNGIKMFSPVGEKFDPNLHQAVFEMPDSGFPNGSVAQVVQAGYMIGERVLRPAMVAVAKGGAKESKSENSTPDDAA
jgi:molecular chaperone GrpE